MRSSTVFSIATLGSLAAGYQLPSRAKSLYDQHKSGSCSKKLSKPFSGGASYCNDIPGVIFLKGSNQYDNMDIDCDGANRSGGACANDPTGQGETAFKDAVKSYGIPDLDANIHPYVVFGNDGSSPSFDPQAHGVKPLSVVAVICNNQVHYGIWGDVNGGTSTGESSLAMGKLCFPNERLTGNNGHDGKDVMYIAFTGSDAVPGKNGANWKAKNTAAFESSIQHLGDTLMNRLY